VRRLYDIANVLASLDLLERSSCPATFRPAYRWLRAPGGAAYPAPPPAVAGRLAWCARGRAPGLSVSHACPPRRAHSTRQGARGRPGGRWSRGTNMRRALQPCCSTARCADVTCMHFRPHATIWKPQEPATADKCLWAVGPWAVRHTRACLAGSSALPVLGLPPGLPASLLSMRRSPRAASQRRTRRDPVQSGNAPGRAGRAAAARRTRPARTSRAGWLPRARCSRRRRWPPRPVAARARTCARSRPARPPARPPRAGRAGRAPRRAHPARNGP